MSDPTAYLVTLKPPDGADGLQLLQAALGLKLQSFNPFNGTNFGK